MPHVERTDRWFNAPRPGVLLQGGQASAYPNFAHDEYQFGLVTGGHLITRRGRSDHLAHSGSLTALHPGEAHEGRSDDVGWSYRLMVIDQSLMRSTQEAAGSSRDLYFPRLVISDDSLAAAFLRAHEVLRDPVSALESDEVLAGLLTAFMAWGDVRSRPDAGADECVARRAVEALHARYAENLSLDGLAHAVGADKYKLIRAFKRLTGLPPHAFQTRLRVSAARRLLTAGMSPGAVALECGFSSQAHLNRHFGRFMGMPPGRFRRILKGA